MDLYKLFSIPVLRYPADPSTYDSIQIQLRDSFELMKSSDDKTCMSMTENVPKTYDFLEKYNCNFLEQRIIEACKAYLEEIGWAAIARQDDSIRIRNSWVNFTNISESRTVHVHPGYTISGVYYFRVNEKQGSIYFNNPNPLGMACEFPAGQIFPQTTDIVPDDGDIILFPSWLMHGTRECKSETERVSVAFNVDLDLLDERVQGLNKGSHITSHPKEYSMKGLLMNDVPSTNI